MAEAFHGTPITSANNTVLNALGSRNYCVSYYRPEQMQLVAAMSRRVMIDNGAFSAHRSGIVLDAAYWGAFYEFVRLWLPRCPPGSFFVIPDVIDAGTQEQDALLRECPEDLLPFGWPVWHMDEPISRLIALCHRFGHVCIGSTAEYWVVGSTDWRARMDEVFAALSAEFAEDLPALHMLRGLQCFLPSFDYPFAQADSTDLARNHNRTKKYGPHRLWAIVQRADRWDAMAKRCKTRWPPARLIKQPTLFDAA